MKFFSNPKTLGFLTLVVVFLLGVLLNLNLILTAMIAILLALAVTILMGNIGSRLQFFFPIYGFIFLAAAMALGIVVGWQAFSGPPSIGIVVGSERIHLVESSDFQNQVLDKIPVKLQETHRAGSLKQATLVKENKLDLNLYQLFWTGDKSQSQDLLDALEAAGKKPRVIDTFYDPFVIIAQRDAMEKLAATNPNHIKKLDNQYFQYEIDTEWLASKLNISTVSWESLGLPEYSDPINILSSNPTKSGGGQLTFMLFVYYWDLEITGTPGIDIPLNPQVAARTINSYQSYYRTGSSGEIVEELVGRGFTPFGMTYLSAALTEKERWENDYVLVKLNPTIVSSIQLVGIGEIGQEFINQLSTDTPLTESFTKVGQQYNYNVVSNSENRSIPHPSADAFNAVTELLNNN